MPRNTSVNLSVSNKCEQICDDDYDSDVDMHVAPSKTPINTTTLEDIYHSPTGRNKADKADSLWDHANDVFNDIEMDDMLYTTQDEIRCEPLVQEPSKLQAMQCTMIFHEDAADWIPESLPAIAGTGSHSAATVDDLVEAEILQRAYLRYGFAPQGNLQDIPPLQGNKEKRNLMQILGFCWYAEKANVLERQQIAHFLHFLIRLSKTESISHLDWDLGKSHTNRLPLLPRYSTIQIVTVSADSTKLYMFCQDNSSSVKWNLAMMTAAHALMVC